MARHKNVSWDCGQGIGIDTTVHHALLAVLQDCREELQALNRKLDCPGVRNAILVALPAAAAAAKRIDKRLSKKVRLKRKPRRA